METNDATIPHDVLVAIGSPPYTMIIEDDIAPWFIGRDQIANEHTAEDE